MIKYSSFLGIDFIVGRMYEKYESNLGVAAINFSISCISYQELKEALERFCKVLEYLKVSGHRAFYIKDKSGTSYEVYFIIDFERVVIDLQARPILGPTSTHIQLVDYNNPYTTVCNDSFGETIENKGV